MREVIEENKDQKNKKIVEIFNEKIEEQGHPSQKIDNKNVKEMEKVSNNISSKKYESNLHLNHAPCIYSVENFQEVLQPFTKEPREGDLNTPLILSSRIGG